MGAERGTPELSCRGKIQAICVCAGLHLQINKQQAIAGYSVRFVNVSTQVTQATTSIPCLQHTKPEAWFRLLVPVLITAMQACGLVVIFGFAVAIRSKP